MRSLVGLTRILADQKARIPADRSADIRGCVDPRSSASRGQSTVEYLLVLVAVLLVVMVAISGAIREKIRAQTTNAAAIMEKASTELKNATGTGPAVPPGTPGGS